MSKILRAPINPEILRWALEDLNLSVEDFSGKTGIKKDKIIEWLSGASYPTYNQLEDISYRILKLPLAAFFLPEPPKNLSIKKKFRTLPEYLLTITSYKTRLAIKRADFYRTALIELYGKNPSPEPLFKKNYISGKQVNDSAKLLRAELGINLELQKKFSNGYQAFNYYRELIENKGIFLFQLQLRGDRGFCLFDDEFPIIIINSSDSINSKIFTLFHEFIHLLIASDDIYKELEPPAYVSDPVEIFCNRVAAEILVPIDELVDRYNKELQFWDESFLLKVSKEYSVSREVIFIKLLNLGYAQQSDYLKLKGKWNIEYKKSKRSGGDYYLNKVSALGKQYISKVINSYKHGLINDVQAAGFLDIKFSNLSKVETEVFAS